MEKGGKSAHLMEQHVEGKNTTCLISYVGLIVPILPHLINICAKCAKFKACFQVSLTSSFLRGMEIAVCKPVCNNLHGASRVLENNS